MENGAAAGLSGVSFTPTAKQLESLAVFADMLTEKNKVMNLTAITEPAEIYQKHFSDSALVLDYVDIPQNARCIDVGTGAGFPGVPICVLRPDTEFVLLDSLNKRVNFLNEVIAELHLNAVAVHARAEDAARSALRDSFDFAFSRAVASASLLLEYCLPFVRPRGTFVAFKSSGARAEFADCSSALSALKASAPTFHEASAPWGARCFVCVTKLAPTPRAYPRKAGTASKSPL